MLLPVPTTSTSRIHRISSIFFEYEFIDMIMNAVRLSNYHNEHHNYVEKNYGAFGFVSDEMCIKMYHFCKNLVIPKVERK